MLVRYLNKNDYIYTLEFNEYQFAKGNKIIELGEKLKKDYIYTKYFLLNKTS